MFYAVCIILLIIEVCTLAWFISGKLKKKNINDTAIYIGVAYIINLAINLIPYLYERIILNQETNILFEVLKSVISTPQAFIGLVDFDKALEFSSYISIYPYTFLLGTLIAVSGTLYATIEAFYHQIINSFKVNLSLIKDKCDIVIGTDSEALLYAKNNKNCIVVANKPLEKNTLISYISKGYIVWNKVFSSNLLKTKNFNKKTVYNFICFSKDNEFIKYLESFISYKKEEKQHKNIRLFLEVEENKIETLRREIVEKNNQEDMITVFSKNELTARDFVENHPVTKYLPDGVILNDSTIKSIEKINCFFVGLSKLSEEILKQFIIENQLIKVENNQYKNHPINYYLFDEKKKNNNYIIKDLLDELKGLNPSEYVDIPEVPFNLEYSDDVSNFKDVIKQIINKVKEKNSYTFIIVDLDDEFKDVDLGAKIKDLLSPYENYHIFVCGKEKYHVDDVKLTYYGSNAKILTHDVIVNESLSIMGKTVNKMYFKQQMQDEKDKPNYLSLVEEKANSSWKKQSYFTMYSNIYSALSLRVKLNLLGLDYVNDGNKNNLDLIKEKYGKDHEKDYESYFKLTKRNALIAQEHARWNAYHLVNEFMPLKKEEISVSKIEEDKVSFKTKNMQLKKHACLVSYEGLDKLSSYLAEKATKSLGKDVSKEQYDLYVYDCALIESSEELLSELGCSIVEK